MATPHNIQTKRDIVKPLQYAGEGDTVAMPTSYASLSLTSPTFAAAGHNTEINLQPDIQHLDTEVLGSEDIVGAVKTGELYAFQISFEPTDTVLMAYAWDAAGGVGTVDESLEFVFTELLNGVENWTRMIGCRATSMTATLERGTWTVQMTFVCKEIKAPATPDPYTTPMYATEPSAPSISHSDAGADPFDWNAIATPENRFSVTVTREMAIEAINGTDQIIYIKSSGRRAEFSVETYVKDTLIEADYLSKTKRAAAYNFSTSPAKAFAFVNALITSYSRTKSAASADAFMESVTARAESITDFA